MTSQMSQNNLEKFKKYLDTNEDVQNNVNDIQYKYGVPLQIYNGDTSKEIIQINPCPLFEQMGLGSNNNMMSLRSSGYDMFTELLDNEELVHSQYDVVAGRWPKKYNEVVLIISEENEISDYSLYTLGLKDRDEVKD